MSPKVVHYGIIGCGMMGQEHIQNINLLAGTRVEAIFEPDPDMAEMAKELAPHAVMVKSIEALLEVRELDCLLIASPNYCHMDQMERVASIRVAMEYRYMPPIQAFLKDMNSVTGGLKMLSIREHRYPFLPKVGDWNRFNRNSGGTFVVRVMASVGQAVNHVDEEYSGEKPDIADHGFVIVDFANGIRASLELCMFAEGSKYQELLTAIGPEGKIEVHVPGPTRMWPRELGPPPKAQLTISPRYPIGPETREVAVDSTLLAAGDHNGSTFYQHQRFLHLVRGETSEAEVSLVDGWRAVVMGQAAQESAATGKAVLIPPIQPHKPRL